MTWARRAAHNLLPLSREKHSLANALKEWFYTGDAYDLEVPEETCQLCDHPDIRYQFLIQNRCTDSELLVGSECINKFQILAVDASGRVLDETASRSKVNRDRGKLIADARKRRCVNALVALLAKEETFDIKSFITYLQDRGAFTPNQLGFLFWRLDKHEVQYVAGDFKVTIRRDREKSQLLSMEDWKLVKILPALSLQQRKYVARQRSYLEE
jgi:hypothetical protein